MKDQEKFRNILFYTILTSGLTFIYGHLLSNDPFLVYDDIMVVGNVEKINSFTSYLQALQKGHIPDIQPVRDFFTFLNYFLLRHTGYGFFHALNMLTFVGMIMGLRKGLNLIFKFEKLAIDGLLLLIAFSPLYISSVAWLSSRKHLLSATFIVWASVHLIRFIQGSLKSWIWFTLFFALSILSQPINILWPCFASLALLFYGKRKDLLILLPSFGVAAVVGILNLKYYSSTYLWISGGYSKYANVLDSGIGASYLVYGRYFLQVLVPYWTSIGEYGYQSWQNILGLSLIAPYYYIFYKLTDLRKPILVFTAFTLGIFPVIWKITHRFGTDTYLVSASIPLLIGLFLIVRASGIKRKIIAPLLALLICGEVAISKEKAKVWDDTFSVFKQAYETEKSFMNQYLYLSWMMTQSGFQDVFNVAADLYEKYPDRIGAQNLLARIIAVAEISVDEKIKLFSRFNFSSRTAGIMMASFEQERGNYNNAYSILDGIMSSHSSLNGVGFGCNMISELWTTSCQKSGRSNCDRLKDIVTKKCDDSINL